MQSLYLFILHSSNITYSENLWSEFFFFFFFLNETIDGGELFCCHVTYLNSQLDQTNSCCRACISSLRVDMNENGGEDSKTVQGA